MWNFPLGDRLDHLFIQHQVLDIGRRDDDTLLTGEPLHLADSEKPP